MGQLSEIMDQVRWPRRLTALPNYSGDSAKLASSDVMDVNRINLRVLR